MPTRYGVRVPTCGLRANSGIGLPLWALLSLTACNSPAPEVVPDLQLVTAAYTPCHSDCLTCSGPTADECTSCAGGAPVMVDVGDHCETALSPDFCAALAVPHSTAGFCVNWTPGSDSGDCALIGCEAGYRVDDDECTACTAITDCAAVTCTTNGDQQCTTCSSGFRLAGNACLACTAITGCAVGAVTCTNGSDQQCTTCSSGTYLVERARPIPAPPAPAPAGPGPTKAPRAPAAPTGSAPPARDQWLQRGPHLHHRQRPAVRDLRQRHLPGRRDGGHLRRLHQRLRGGDLRKHGLHQHAPTGSAPPARRSAAAPAALTCTNASDQQCTTCGSGTYLVNGTADTCADLHRRLRGRDLRKHGVHQHDQPGLHARARRSAAAPQA